MTALSIRLPEKLQAHLQTAAQSPAEMRRATLAMAEELADDGLNAIIADERAAGLEPGEKWWR